MLFIEEVCRLADLSLNPRPFTSVTDVQGFCVYGYLREEDDDYGPAGSVRYVGEGTPARPLGDHRVRVPSEEFIVIFVDQITKEKGWEVEESLISHFGRIWNGSGILENIKPHSNRWDNSGVFYAKNIHTGETKWIPTDHPDRGTIWVGCQTGTSVNYETKKCRFCDQMSLSPVIHVHERSCVYNPTKVPGYNKGLVVAKNKVTGETALVPSETLSDPTSSWVGVMHGKKFEKISCPFCESKVSLSTIEKHIKQCPENPDSVPDIQKGRSKKSAMKKVIAPDGTVYDSIRSAAIAFGVQPHTITGWIGKSQDGWKFCPSNKSRKPPVSGRKKKIVGPDGTIYDSRTEAAKINNIPLGTLQSQMSRGQSEWRWLE